MPERLRAPSAFPIVVIGLLSAPAAASYGQMNLTFGALATLPGAVLALPCALLEWIGSSLPRLRPWLLIAGVAALLVGLTWRTSFADTGGGSGGAPLAVVGGLAVMAMTLAWLPLRWQRVALITAGTLIWHFTMLAGPRRDDDGVWLLAGFALGWALVSVLRGEARRDPRPQMVEGDPAFHALSRSALRPSSARRAWEAASPARRAFFDRATALVRQPSVLIRGLLVFLIFYGGSALLVATGVEPLSGIILSFAGALPGAVDVPTHDQPAALAYWLSYGMLPALLLTLAGLPWWSRSPP